MSSRPCFAFLAALAILTASPAAAQTPEEIVGLFPMKVVSKYGPCQTDPTFEVEVKGFEGGNIKLLLGGRPYTAPYDANGRRFHVETRDDDIGARVTMDGVFIRSWDAVVLDANATWAVGCGGRIVGRHPAGGTTTPGTTPGTPTGPTTGTGAGDATPGVGPGAGTTSTGSGEQPGIIVTGQPPETFTYGGASTPEPSAAVCPPTGMSLWLCISLALIMFVLGLIVGWILFRRRDEEPARPKQPKAAADKPEGGSDDA